MRSIASAVVWILALGASVPAQAGTWVYSDGLEFTSSDSEFRLGIYNRLQVRGTLEDVETRDSKGSFDVARYQLTLAGRAFNNLNFRLQANLADGSETEEQLLEDAYLHYVNDRKPIRQYWAGQGKVPFGRQLMTSSATLQFVDRSIATERFSHGRDVGIGMMGHNKRRTYAYNLGIYNGNGINKDEGDNVDYMGVARLVVTPMGVYHPDGTETDRRREAESEMDGLREVDVHRHEEAYVAIGVSALTNTIGTTDVEETRVQRGCLELAFQKSGWNLAAEFFTESQDPLVLDQANLEDDPDEEDTDGWYFQGGYLFARVPLEIGLRYSEILADDDRMDETEAGIAFGYYFSGHRWKVQADFRRLTFEIPTPPKPEERLDRNVLRFQLQVTF